jgi:hypothetical protein
MKLGKRRWESKLEQDTSAAATPPAEPLPESWNVPADPEPAEPEPADPASAAPAAEEPATVVDGDAVELPMTEVPAGEPLAFAAPAPDSAPAFYEPEPPPMPYPVAEEPVLVYTSSAATPAVTPLAEAGEAHASGHASGTSPSWPEPVMALAAERPEVVVGAAFAGGLLFAMILRRLGS